VIVLLDALKILKDKGYSFLCDFVGGETKKIDNKRFEFEVTYRGLAQVVSYNGVKKGPDKNKYYENADVFVFPSFYENETFGLVNIEAMSYGLPIVTTDEGGITDIVKDGENGLICKKNDPNSLADKIAVLIDDESLRLKIGKNNLKKFQEYYTDKCFERNMISILNSVLKS
jgi:glycosyltransferase involved in cell wall biosynthesis